MPSVVFPPLHVVPILHALHLDFFVAGRRDSAIVVVRTAAPMGAAARREMSVVELGIVARQMTRTTTAVEISVELRCTHAVQGCEMN
jgi:hypothetical protein